MSRKKNFLSIVSLVLLLIQLVPNNKVHIPVTYLLDEPNRIEDLVGNRELNSFILEMYTPDNYSLQGVYVDDKFQLPIVYQPAGNAGYVSNSADHLTRFSTADNYGSVGLIAHNHLAGMEFFELAVNDIIRLVYGDGHIEEYLVTEIREYQALSPNSPYSSFVNLAQPEVTISYRDLFFDTYGISDRLVMQTCIARNGLDSWGRLFVIATPIPVKEYASLTP